MQRERERAPKCEREVAEVGTRETETANEKRERDREREREREIEKAPKW